MDDAIYSGDAIYAHYDGYGIELRLNDHRNECAIIEAREREDQEPGMGLSCSLPRWYIICSDNGDPDYFYLSAPSGEVIASGEDADELFVLAWQDYRKSRKRNAP